MRNKTLPRVADLFDREHHTGFGVVVVVADGHGPRQLRSVVGSRWQIGVGERIVIDGSAHCTSLARLRAHLENDTGFAPTPEYHRVRSSITPLLETQCCHVCSARISGVIAEHSWP